ncbi:hypothetical protein DY000_02037857 [Brassica cretica]|uniref:Uncharacterized protein n=1 Tax=Brassica cretica TaxID=69181 RepID=A0ABQ7BAE0_BRACR|nr:hypothetical protein DY000_02037857 [Brassica cretica]
MNNTKALNSERHVYIAWLLGVSAISTPLHLAKGHGEGGVCFLKPKVQLEEHRRGATWVLDWPVRLPQQDGFIDAYREIGVGQLEVNSATRKVLRRWAWTEP